MFECIRMTTNDIIYNTQGVVELLAGCFLLVTWGFRCAKWCPKWCQGSFQVFTNDILPSDIKQGALGDCWFLAALAAVAEDPDLIRRLLGDPKVNKHGVYEAWLRFVEQKIHPWTKKKPEPLIIVDQSCGDSPGMHQGDQMLQEWTTNIHCCGWLFSLFSHQRAAMLCSCWCSRRKPKFAQVTQCAELECVWPKHHLRIFVRGTIRWQYKTLYIHI